jgi:cell division protein FtsQ
LIKYYRHPVSIVVLLMLGSVYALSLWLKDPYAFPITRVVVRGSHTHVSESALKKIIVPYTRRGFFGIPLSSLQKTLLRKPWFASVMVSRQWPHTLLIQCKEHEPLAVWNKYGLLTASAFVFYPAKSSLPEDLPHFTAPMDDRQQVLDSYNQFLVILKPTHFKLTALTLSHDGEWLLTLDHRTVITLGRADALERLKRFVLSYKQAFVGHKQLPQSVDLRYSHGFAIKWQP